MRVALLPLLLSAAACSTEPEAPGTVTVDEERQLDEAAAMLDANSVAANAVEDPQ